MARATAGFTLLEMLVVLVLLGLMSGVAIVASSRAFSSNSAQAPEWEMAEARRTAIREGRTVSVEIRSDSSVVVATFLPDGSGVVDGAGMIDRFSGRPAMSSEPAR